MTFSKSLTLTKSNSALDCVAMCTFVKYEVVFLIKRYAGIFGLEDVNSSYIVPNCFRTDIKSILFVCLQLNEV